MKDISVVNKFFRKLFIDEVSRFMRDGRCPNPIEWEEENDMYEYVVKPHLFASLEDGGKFLHMMKNIVGDMYDNGELG